MIKEEDIFGSIVCMRFGKDPKELNTADYFKFLQILYEEFVYE